jgi:hypothetical protein
MAIVTLDAGDMDIVESANTPGDLELTIPGPWDIAAVTVGPDHTRDAELTTVVRLVPTDQPGA